MIQSVWKSLTGLQKARARALLKLEHVTCSLSCSEAGLEPLISCMGGRRANQEVGLLDYDKNHNHEYFGQYCNHDYL